MEYLAANMEEPKLPEELICTVHSFGKAQCYISSSVCCPGEHPCICSPSAFCSKLNQVRKCLVHMVLSRLPLIWPPFSLKPVIFHLWPRISHVVSWSLISPLLYVDHLALSYLLFNLIFFCTLLNNSLSSSLEGFSFVFSSFFSSLVIQGLSCNSLSLWGCIAFQGTLCSS